MEFGDRLKEIRNYLELTQKDFSHKLGIQYQVLAKYEHNKVKPSISFLNDLVSAYSINPMWLLTGRGNMLNDDTSLSTQPSNNNLIPIKYYKDVNVSAGYGALNDDNSDYITLNMDKTFLDMLGATSFKNIDAVNVFGDSMSPFAKDGEIAIIDKTKEPKNNDVIVATYEGDTYIKRLHKEPFSNDVTLSSINPSYKDINITLDEFNTLNIVGVVVGVFSVRKLN